jgi:integrase
VPDFVPCRFENRLDRLLLDEKGRDQVREKFTEKIANLLRPANANVPSAAMLDGLLTLEQFIVQGYWPRCEQRQQLEGANHIEPSTIHGYRKIFKKHIVGKPIASIPINKLTTKDGQDFLDSLPQNLSHKTHLRVRAFLSSVLTAALQSNVISGTNPMDATKAGGLSKGRKESQLSPRELKIRASNKHAYEHAEVALMLEKLPEPARTICAVAAFTGLTRSEIPALKWEDYDGKTINVMRKKWQQHIGSPKTEAREAAVPVAPLLHEILAKYRANEDFPVEDNWMFYGQKEKKPIDMDNLSRREIPHQWRVVRLAFLQKRTRNAPKRYGDECYRHSKDPARREHHNRARVLHVCKP